jgi:DNA-binding response OmpR family regulator
MARERRVLLVEDDQDMAAIYWEQFRRDGIPLEFARSGKDADEFVRSRVPALVLIDLTLPDLAGKNLIESWAGDEMLSEIPIWIISNAMSEDNPWWHETLNVQRYFLKSRIVLARLSLEIRATLGLPYGERLNSRTAS